MTGERRRSPRSGFTLLEVMVAISILAGGLAVVLEINTRNAKASTHAKMMTAATFLARAQMSRLEDDLDQNGFPEQEDRRAGSFADDGFPTYRWEAHIEKIELPSNFGDAAQKAATEKQAAAAAQQAATSMGGYNPTSLAAGGAASVILSQFELIRTAIEQSIRKVTLRVVWPEGKRDKSIEIATFFTDPAQVDFALPGLGALGAAAGQGGHSGATGQQTPGQGTPGLTGTPGSPLGGRPPGFPPGFPGGPGGPGPGPGGPKP
jgi:prepilin-type N-terminal cleavage/methylation domain-containing protein